MKFEEMKISKALSRALAAMHLVEPTVIQQRAFPAVMSGRDVLGIAQTGTGKTIGYLLPCLNQWKFTAGNPPQILVLVPTRELVVQVVEVARQLAEGTSVKCVGVFGGVGMVPQAEAVRAGADVLVGTPGRLLDLILDGHVSLRTVKKLVVDEVDEMLDQGFRTQLGRLFDLLPRKRQNLLFSATMTAEIESLIDTYFNSPVKIEAAPTGTPLENIRQYKFEVPNFNTKINLLRLILTDETVFTRVLVFVGSIALADKVFELVAPAFDNQIDYIHSKRTQSQRFGAVRNFAEGKLRILIATDVVARGIDVADVSHVINFDLPDEPEQYIHRIGRTGRADKEGVSFAFCSPLEQEKLAEIEALMGKEITTVGLPAELEISDRLTDFELPTYRMRNTLVETDATPGGAFHEKSEKNKKVNVRVSHAELMRRKYGKPITKGGNKKKPRH
ncbi:MAG: DEAD/DEAH box helicase [Bacteroidales bacterium]|nr:DEAD/DEAH box helicase [Bacteroidales bacterium]